MIPIDDFVLRQAICDFKTFLKLPTNSAAQIKARLSLENLEAHLPEVIQAEIKKHERIL